MNVPKRAPPASQLQFADKIAALFTENFSYKVVSLFIALILWLAILGRRDFVMNKSLDVDFIAAPGVVVHSQSAERIHVKVSGPRTALRKFMASGLANSLTIDISDKGEGIYEVDVPPSKVEVPIGVKVIEVRPHRIRVEVLKE